LAPVKNPAKMAGRKTGQYQLSARLCVNVFETKASKAGELYWLYPAGE